MDGSGAISTIGVTVKMDMRRTLAVGLAALMIGACSQETIQREDVIGVYESDYPNASEVLTLYQDGRYLHIFSPKKNGGFENRGTWRFYAHEDDFRVVLSSFRFTDRSASQSGPPGSEWPAIVERQWGSIVIPINIDSGPRYRFIKRSNAVGP